jgi:HK97 gp10 family phage protein
MRLVVQLKGVDPETLGTKALIAAARRGLKYGVPEAAMLMVQEAKALVPVDTGALQASIHAETLEESDNRLVQAVTADRPYARRIEYGFVGADSLGRVYHQAAQPYMRPAFDSQKEAMREAIRDSIYAELDAQMAKQGKR